jgi:hypothetical protein
MKMELADLPPRGNIAIMEHGSQVRRVSQFRSERCFGAGMCRSETSNPKLGEYDDEAR